jgi:hypothetical protein
MKAHAASVAHVAGVFEAKKNQSGSANGVKVGVRNGSAERDDQRARDLRPVVIVSSSSMTAQTDALRIERWESGGSRSGDCLGESS